MGRPRKEIAGRVFGWLKAIGPADNIAWHCHCACGHRMVVRTNHLLNGRTRSCGCWRWRPAEIRRISRDEAILFFEHGIDLSHTAMVRLTPEHSHIVADLAVQHRRPQHVVVNQLLAFALDHMKASTLASADD